MMASDSENRPPAPMPWMARNAASSYIDWDSPHSIDPTMKMLIANRMNGLRPYMSESLPYSGVEIVDVIEERGRRPHLQREAVQVVGDGTDRGRDDRLVECGEEHREHQTGQDGHDLLVVEGAAAAGGVCVDRGRCGHRPLPVIAIRTRPYPIHGVDRFCQPAGRLRGGVLRHAVPMVARDGHAVTSASRCP